MSGELNPFQIIPVYLWICRHHFFIYRIPLPKHIFPPFTLYG
ncbi:hypothetical protein HMPREF1548_02664 [Clostridium sp. KLE 1755]|nr:hypothetical protein HMPREF1548_02664 [Clostridium sp. KLE 1755]